MTGAGTREEDFIEHLFIASTHSYILVFTDRGRVHWLKVHEIPQGGRTAKGKAIVNMVEMSQQERVAVLFELDRMLRRIEGFCERDAVVAGVRNLEPDAAEGNVGVDVARILARRAAQRLHRGRLVADRRVRERQRHLAGGTGIERLHRTELGDVIVGSPEPPVQVRQLLAGNKDNPATETPGLIKEGDDLANELRKVSLAR